MIVKNTDNPSTIEPDYGNIWGYFIFRGCDGSYGCSQEPDGNLIHIRSVFSELYTYQTLQTPYARQCPSGVSNQIFYNEEKSWPGVYTYVDQDQIQDDCQASLSRK